MKAKHLVIAVIVVLFAVGILTGPICAEIEPESVIALWLMDEKEDDIAVDSSENGSGRWCSRRFF